MPELNIFSQKGEDNLAFRLSGGSAQGADSMQKQSYLLGCSALFLVSAGTGWWVAFDAQSALLRFSLLCVGLILVLAAALFNRAQRVQAAPIAAIVATGIAGGLAGYYLVIGQFGHDTLSGIVGSAIAILVPFAGGSVAWALQTKRRLLAVFCGAMTVLAVAGLLLSGERGAWLSVAAGLLVAALCWWGGRNGSHAKSVSLVRWTFALFGIAGIGSLIAFLGVPAVSQWLIATVHLNPQSDLFSRRELWNNTLTLIGDYPFTGSGLTSPKMALATYVYIQHVASQPHAHNLYLQVGAEQGWLGMVALAGMIVCAMMLAVRSIPARTNELQGLRLAAIASSVTLAVYGLLDAEVYAYPTVPLVFVPIAFALLIRTSSKHPVSSSQSGRIQHRSQKVHTASWNWLVLPTFVLVIIVGVIWLNGSKLRSALFANLGTIAQTQAELSVYQWPEWGVQDQLRRDENRVNLGEAERYWQIALALNPNNETALRRFGQIALSRGEYAKAEELLNAAWQVSSDQRATRQLLGEALAIRGKTSEAAALWKNISWVEGQLAARIWWYEQLGDQKAVENMRLAMRLATQ